MKNKQNMLSLTFLIIDFVILVIVSFLFLRMESYFSVYNEQLEKFDQKLSEQIFTLSSENFKSKYDNCELINISIGNETLSLIAGKCLVGIATNYYNQGTNDGYALAIQQIMKQANSCDPFRVFFGNTTMYLLNYACVNTMNS